MFGPRGDHFAGNGGGPESRRFRARIYIGFSHAYIGRYENKPRFGGARCRLADRAGFEHVATMFSTNGTFWTWTFHSLLHGRIPAGINDAVFPSDFRFVRNTLWNVARIGAFSLIDAINVALTGRSSNMLVVLRKPAGAHTG